jgi:hypothetical protein
MHVNAIPNLVVDALLLRFAKLKTPHTNLIPHPLFLYAKTKSHLVTSVVERL